jgi:hypothetical protein
LNIDGGGTPVRLAYNIEWLIQMDTSSTKAHLYYDQSVIILRIKNQNSLILEEVLNN